MATVGWLAVGKMVIYPIRNDLDGEGRQLINWVAEIQSPRNVMQDWSLTGRLEDFYPAFEQWRFDWLDVAKLIREADTMRGVAAHRRQALHAHRGRDFGGGTGADVGRVQEGRGLRARESRGKGLAGVTAAHCHPAHYNACHAEHDRRTVIRSFRHRGLERYFTKSERKGVYSVWMSGNWRITFEFEAGDAVRVNLEDYH